jgi:TolB-like protein
LPEVLGQLIDVTLNGRYHVTAEVGRGGMATVYRAHDTRDDREVAVKVLLPDVGLAVGPERFRREIDVTSRFSHPRILPLYDSGTHEGQLFYVMPFVAGESLRARLDRFGALGIDEAIRLGAEVADALDYAHTHGVIHRDIKPENILLDDGHALVVDFGIARAAAAGTEKLTQTGVTIGTPHYMSPEQAMADKNLDGRSDIYALGCVVYEMLAGHPPFSGGSAQAIIARHALEPTPSISIVRPTVTPPLEAVLFQALAKSPADRWSTAHEFAEALRNPDEARVSRWATPNRAPTGVFTPGPRAARPARRRWAEVALAAAVLAAAGAIWGMSHRSPAVSTGSDARSIAITYFEDLSPNHSLDYLASGLTEQLIDRLGQVKNLSVISRGGVAPFKGGTALPDSIARALHVGTLVRGSVEQDGNTFHVNVRLVDGRSGADFERAAFDQPAAKVLGLADALVTRVAAMIRRRVGQEVQLRAQQEGTQNADAWALVQRASSRREAGERAMKSNDTAGVLSAFRGADSMLVEASALDRRWPEPEVDRALIDYRASRFFGDNPLGAAPWIDSGVVHTARARTLDAKNATAFELQGTLRYWRYLLGLEPDVHKADDSLRAAQADLETATKLNPAQAGAWAALSHLYAAKGDLTDAKLAAERAYAEDAYLANADLVLWRLFGTSYDIEQFPEAVRWCNVGAQRFPAEPRFVECQLRLAATAVVSVSATEIWKLADTLVTLSPEGERTFRRGQGQALAAAALARGGSPDSARHVLARINVPTDADPTRDIDMDKAFAFTLAGDKDAALRELKNVISANPDQGSALADDNGWRFRSIRDDPRFQALVHKDNPSTETK